MILNLPMILNLLVTANLPVKLDILTGVNLPVYLNVPASVNLPMGVNPFVKVNLLPSRHLPANVSHGATGEDVVSESIN